jgi:hypothetical protein
LAGLTLAAAVALGLRRGWRDGRLMLLAWLVVLPVAIPVLVSALTRPLFVDRYAIAALAGMCGLAGVGVMRLGRTAGSGVLLIMLALSVRAAVTSPPPEWRLPWRELAGEVNAAAEPGDVVLVSQPYQTSPVILHYLTANVGVAELPVNDAAAAIGRWRSQGNSVWIIARSGEAPRVLAAAGRPRRLWQQPGLDLLYYDAPW